MDTAQTYYMEKDSQFWEMKVADKNTMIRYGKIGKPGRKLATKQHDSAYKAKQFAIRQVNGKIIQGFQDPNVVVPRAPMIKLLSRRSSVRLQRLQTLKSKKTLKSAIGQIQQRNLSLKRQSTLQLSKLKRSDTLLVTKSQPSSQRQNQVEETVKPKPQWRKPPKKQSTIRRQAKQISVLKKDDTKNQKKSGSSVDKGGVRVGTQGGDDPNLSVARQDTVSVTGRLTTDISRRHLLKNKNSTMKLPVLDRKSSSWDRPHMGNKDLSMPRLSLQVHETTGYKI